MKKFFILFLVAVFISSSFSSFLLAAEILSLEGKVEVKPAQEKAWKRAEVGTKVDIGDTIRTASRSKAHIALDKARKNIITLQEKSLLVLYSSNAVDLDQVALGHGLVYARIEKIKEGLTFEVHTPSSVAGVRGTAGSVDSVPERDVIACYEDQMYAQSFDEYGNLISETTIDEGLEVEIPRFEEIGEKVEISKEKEQQWNEQSNEMDKAIETAPTPEEKAETEAEAKAAEEAAKAAAEAAAAAAETEDLVSTIDEIDDITDIQDEVVPPEPKPEPSGGNGGCH